MKLSSETLDILRSFSNINNGILVKPGQSISTMSTQKTILAKAEVSEVFDKQFCIYDLSQFLGTLKLFKDPDLDFQDKKVIISENNTTVKYAYASVETIVSPPNKELVCDEDIQFLLTQDEFMQLTKAAAVLGVPNFVVTNSAKETSGKNNQFEISAIDIENSSSNGFALYVDQIVNPDSAFNAVFKFENLKLLPDDYTVTISKSGIAHFVGKQVQYFVTAEHNSSKF